MTSTTPATIIMMPTTKTLATVAATTLPRAMIPATRYTTPKATIHPHFARSGAIVAAPSGEAENMLAMADASFLAVRDFERVARLSFSLAHPAAGKEAAKIDDPACHVARIFQSRSRFTST